MIITEQSAEILRFDSPEIIERAGRTCYKSEDRMDEESAKPFVAQMYNAKDPRRGHHAMLEHAVATVHFKTDRGVTHELVRHRLASFAQESTRYVNYGKKGLQFILPVWFEGIVHEYGLEDILEVDKDGQLLKTWAVEKLRCISDADMALVTWLASMRNAECDYKKMLSHGQPPQFARSVLPNSLKTEIVVTANFREWTHIFNLRTDKALTGKPHPQMQQLMQPVLEEFNRRLPEVFTLKEKSDG